MSTWTHRERVLAAFHHEQPDRIPIDLMGNACMILDGSYLRLRDHLGLSPIPPVRSGTTANYYDERILDYLDIDFRRIFLKKAPGARGRVLDDGTVLDAWGIGYTESGGWVHATVSPLHDVTTVEEVEGYDWPQPDQMFSAEGLAAEAKRLYEETDHALVARNPLTYGFLDRACQLMQMPEFLMNLVQRPLVAEAIIRHLLDVYKGIYGLFLDAVGPYVQMVEVGDDLGAQQNLLISPPMYRQFIKPAEREFYALIHEKAPNAFLFRHTDGAIYNIIPDLIEVGVDVLNPVQTSSRGMEGQRLKAAYGSQIVFHGAMEHLEGDVTVDQIAAEVRDRVANFAPGGGYVLASCNSMIDVKPENIIALFETARDVGRYV